ncbi:uncharacterized protein [Haliotis asinina]|uniref:uncharacterized protein n=1 Tax=Haliotis asinina TaxID=109174 RepID=UPI003531FC3A
MVSIPKTKLSGGLEIAKILNGMWQVSGAHGNIDPSKAVEEMLKYFDAGLTTFDLADIYGPAEEIYGAFVQKLASQRGADAVSRLQGLTKFVPRPGPMSRQVVEGAIARSMQRMKVSRLDCVQFHWWDYSDKRYLDALKHLQDLRMEGKIGEVALTNFDTARLQEIIDHGVTVSSNQVQFSLLDMRPATKMAPVCEANNVKILAYGVLGGGLISEKYLGKAEPKGRSVLNTASLSKYKNMIDTWGGWPLFQELLQVLDQIAKTHNVSISNIAANYILAQPAVGGVILGCRLGVPGCEHIDDNLRALTVNLTDSDKLEIDSVLKKGRDLMAVIGDCGDEYR